MKTKILYHDDCPDGFGSAFAAWKKFGDKAEYIACQYGKPAPEIEAGSIVFVLDFSFTRKEIEELKAKCEYFYLIDHHIGAREKLEGLDCVRFDMEKSGAVLSWEYFHPLKPIPELLKYVQDRDLWKFKLEKSKEVTSALSSYQNDFLLWNELIKKGAIKKLMKDGEGILRYRQRSVERICKDSFFAEKDGAKIVCVNSSSLQSEIGNHLLEQYPQTDIAIIFYRDKDKYYYSVRSKTEKAQEFAKRYGGDGHLNAAGFNSGKFIITD